jgi:hypothetical protein
MTGALRRFVLAFTLVASSLAGLALSQTPAGALPSSHDIVDYSVAASGLGTWGATNASLQSLTTTPLRSQVTLSVLGVEHIYGLDAAGNLYDLSSDGADGSWRSTNLSSLTGGPAIASSIVAISIIPGQVAVMGIGTGSMAGHLIEYATDGSASLWVVRDLSAGSGLPALVSGPSLVIDSTLQFFSTDAAGDVIEDSLSAGTWLTRNLTAASSLPAVAGQLSASLCPGAAQAICVFGRSTSGDLLEFAHLSGGIHAWRTSDLSTSLGVGTLLSDPVASRISGKEVVAAVTEGGSLSVLTSSSSDFSPAAAHQRSFTARTRSAALGTVPIALAATSLGLLVAAASTSGHLLAFTALRSSAGFGFGSIASADVTAQATPSTTVSGQLSIGIVGWTLHIAAGSSIVPGPRTDVLADGQSLAVSASLTSSNGTYWAGLRPDGHLMVATGAQPITILEPASAAPARLRMGHDGNLKASDASGHLLWQLGSSTGPGTSLVLRPDGDLQLVTGSGTIAWTSSSGVDDRIVSTVESQLGVRENPLGSNCNPYTGFFSRGSSAGCPAGWAAEAWCSDFANWAWLGAGANVAGITGWSWTYVDYGQAHGTFKQGSTNDPQPGDAVVWGQMNNSYGDHVGTVVAVYLGYIDVVSGNDDSQVADSGWFNPATSTVDGDPIVGYISPVPASSGLSARAATSFAPAVSQAQINSQDGGH